MINAKVVYNTLLNNNEITALVPAENILNAYPNGIENFPCIIFLDESQSDTEYNDNKPGASSCTIAIHIYSKKVDGFVSTSNVAIAIANVMNNDLWHCSQNGETSDPDPSVEHRVMRFEKSIFIN